MDQVYMSVILVSRVVVDIYNYRQALQPAEVPVNAGVVQVAGIQDYNQFMLKICQDFFGVRQKIR